MLRRRWKRLFKKSNSAVGNHQELEKGNYYKHESGGETHLGRGIDSIYRKLKSSHERICYFVVEMNQIKCIRMGIAREIFIVFLLVISHLQGVN